MTYVVVGTKAKPILETEVKQMFEDRFPEGLVRVLEGKFPAARHMDCEDAVATGFEKLTRKGPTTNPRGYVTTVAINAMTRILRRAVLEQLALDDDEEHEPYVNPWTDPTLEEVVAQNAYEFMREVVGRWESLNLRATTTLIIEAGRLGEPLSSAELAERLEEILGQDVLPDTARQWRKRGLDRLRDELIAEHLLEKTERS